MKSKEQVAFQMGKDFAEYINGAALPLGPDDPIPSMEHLAIQTKFGWCGKTLCEAWKRGFNSIVVAEKSVAMGKSVN